MTPFLIDRLRLCANQSAQGRNFADTPQACREAADEMAALIDSGEPPEQLAMDERPFCPEPVDGPGDVVAEALANLLPGKLCGESWNLPDDETVSIMVTFGALRAARSAVSA